MSETAYSVGVYMSEELENYCEDNYGNSNIALENVEEALKLAFDGLPSVEIDIDKYTFGIDTPTESLDEEDIVFDGELYDDLLYWWEEQGVFNEDSNLLLTNQPDDDIRGYAFVGSRVAAVAGTGAECADVTVDGQQGSDSYGGLQTAVHEVGHNLMLYRGEDQYEIGGDDCNESAHHKRWETKGTDTSQYATTPMAGGSQVYRECYNEPADANWCEDSLYGLKDINGCQNSTCMLDLKFSDCVLQDLREHRHVRELSNSDVGEDTATLSCDITGTLDNLDHRVQFRWRPSHESTWEGRTRKETEEDGTVSATATDLSSSTEYEYQALLEFHSPLLNSWETAAYSVLDRFRTSGGSPGFTLPAVASGVGGAYLVNRYLRSGASAEE